MLYSASDIKRDGNNVRVWIEFLSAKDVASFDVNAHPDAMQNVLTKVRGGYRPPFATRHKFDIEKTAQVTLAEEVADEKESPILLRALYEIDCVGERHRTLSFSAFQQGEEKTHSAEPTGWEYAPPDTPIADLTAWACGPAPRKK